jgi:hypothetical protein
LTLPALPLQRLPRLLAMPLLLQRMPLPLLRPMPLLLLVMPLLPWATPLLRLQRTLLLLLAKPSRTPLQPSKVAVSIRPSENSGEHQARSGGYPVRAFCFLEPTGSRP